jgi:hypothetical protein
MARMQTFMKKLMNSQIAGAWEKWMGRVVCSFE